MTVKGLKDIPANDCLALKVYDVEHAWSRLAAGKRTIAAFEEFCGAIRFSMFEYRAHMRRNSRVSFDETAAKLAPPRRRLCD